MSTTSDNVRRLEQVNATAERMRNAFPVLRDELLDLDRYMDAPPEAAHVKPVNAWADEVVDRIVNGRKYTGAPLPWSRIGTLFGLRPAEVTVWAGPGGTGKSMLTSQVALTLARQGAKLCIASLEMPPAITGYRMVRQALGGYPPFEPDVRTILDAAGRHIWLYEQTGMVKWHRMVALARYCAAELKTTHFFIDSLMKCGIAKDDYNTQIQFVDALCALAKDTGMHVHLVTHTRKGVGGPRSEESQDVRGAGEITDLVDNVMMLSRNREKELEAEKNLPDEEVMNGPDAVLACTKDRNGEWQGRLRLWYHETPLLFLDSQAAKPEPMEWTQASVS